MRKGWLLGGLVLGAWMAFAGTAHPLSPTAVLTPIYGGGGNGGSTYRNDFSELFNLGSTPVDLTGWSVQYASAGGTSWSVTPLTSVILQPGHYYLVQEAAGVGGT